MIEVYLSNLASPYNSSKVFSTVQPSNDNSFYSEGNVKFGDISIGPSLPDGKSNELAASLETLPSPENCIPPLKITIENDNSTNDNSLSNTPDNTTANESQDNNPHKLPIPKSKSIAYHTIDEGKAIYLSLDIKTGGENCGILQLFAQIFCIIGLSKKKTIVTDNSDDIFNKYVKPPDNSIWDSIATDIHGLQPSSPVIQNAKSINEVWGDFINFINDQVKPKEVCIMHPCCIQWGDVQP